MSRLVLSSSIFQDLHSYLFTDSKEACAILFGRSVLIDNRLTRIVVHELLLPSLEDYDDRTPISVQLNSAFIARISTRAKKTGESIVFVHSHPGTLDEFSLTDDEGEKVLSNFFKIRTPGIIHASLLLTVANFRARILGEDTSLAVQVVGIELNSSAGSNVKGEHETYDRQIRAFGKDGQAKLAALTVAIVGVGGTGSIVAQQLAHLGVSCFFLMDPDVLEKSNLNRVVGSTPEGVGRLKVEITQKLICDINPKAKVRIFNESVLKNSSARKLIDADFIFACTDSHGSRAILNQLAYQYLIPTIDMGVIITVQNQKISNIAARTQMLAPGLGCMVCGNLLDYEEVRRDLLTDFERKLDPYIPDEHEPSPAVISINGTIASMAVTMFLNAVAGVPGLARLVNYNAMTGVTRSAFCSPVPTCVICSKNGSFAMADTWDLPGRKD